MEAGKKVVVVGAGVIGASIAYNLTLKGVKPLIVEKTGVACAASGKAGGFLALDWCDHTASGPLARESFKLHEKLTEEFGNDVGFRHLSGTYSVTVSETSPAKKGKKESGTWLDGNVRGKSEIGTAESTAQVHPRLLTEAFIGEAVKRGAELRIATVEGVEVGGDGKKEVTGVRVDGEVVPADVVVLAMGPWTGEATKWLPTLPPVSGTKAHSIVVRPTNPVPAEALFLNHVDANGRKSDPEIYPRPDGEVYICGCSSDELLPASAENVLPEDGTAEKLMGVARTVSSCFGEGTQLLCSQACYLPTTPDGVPHLGRVPGVEGAFVAAGHSCWGILNGPATGRAMAELIVEGRARTVDLDPFDPARFTRRK